MPATPAPRESASGSPPGAPVACKICLIGEPGAGKSSLVQRLVHGRFPASPPGPGITVTPHHLPPGVPVMLWDVDGRSAIDTLSQAFLSRIDAAAAVVDPGAEGAIGRALLLIEHLRRVHPQTPAALLLNKRDLGAAPRLPALPQAVVLFEVSARDGAGVEDAFRSLARMAMQSRAVTG